MPDMSALDALWILIAAMLVLIMQGGFLCLESGLTRSKNAINVALKNAFDLIVTAMLFWLFGFGIMFGAHEGMKLDTHWFLADFSRDEFWHASFFFFQLTFCATAATIVSGAIAERSRFVVYIIITALISLLLYPVFGHWVWSSAVNESPGWLEAMGFTDFAGSTVVHSVGGWVALAAVIVIGPRTGRFIRGKVQNIPGSNLPLAILGMLFFMIGWIGFNGGSTLAFTTAIAGIIVNTIIAAAAGGITAILLSKTQQDNSQTTSLTINGTLAGLVAITAGCHVVSTPQAAVIGSLGALVMFLAEKQMHRLQLDDAISAVPVHLVAGIWGTLAVALFGDLQLLDTGLSRFDQLQVQLLGIFACALFIFPLTITFLFLLNRFIPLRVSIEAEQQGLNVSEHGAKTELTDLLSAMQTQERSGDLKQRVPVEPFTEVGQIASQYNRVIANLNRMVTRTRLIVRDMRDGVITFSSQGIVTSANPGVEIMFGLPAHQLVGQPTDVLLHEQNQQTFSGTSPERLFVTLASSQQPGPYEIIARHSQGNPFTLEVTTTASPTEEGVQYSAMLRDISERKKMEARLHRHSELAQVTLEAITEAVVTCDAAYNIVYLNPMASELLGQTSEEAFGKPIDEIILIEDSEATPINITTLCQQYSVKTPNTSQKRLFLLKNKQGDEFEVQLNCAPLLDTNRQNIGWVVALQDITQNSRLQKMLSFQAVHDTLTGLINRREFEKRLESLINEAHHDKAEHLLCYLDLDQFKLVNDTCGHRAGDVLLKQLSNLLKPVLRQSDTLARLGGDEFGVLLSHCPIEKGLDIAETLRKTVTAFRFSWEGQVFSVGVSIGLVSITEASGSLDEVLSHADAACYAAKDRGRNRVHLFQPDDIQAQEHQGQIQWASRLQEALDQDLFRLYYQTIVPLENSENTMPHYEILARMISPQGEIIPPGAFTPAAERFGLMPKIDQWVIRNTLAWMGDQLRQNNQPVFCSINLSGASIGREDCLQLIQEQLAKRKVPANNICFEITETAAIADPANAARFITELKRLGCQFALDDFGSGLSSFGYLKQLPVDYLKIDGIFIQELANNRIDQAMVASINNIGHIMGLKTIAEFVEDAATLNILRQIGVDYVQGFYLSRPEPLESLMSVRVMPR
ncbi:MULTISPECIES: ammonium transporter [unclassified Methylophaga]|jgi:Amt family ammonium transporter|uniref:ammonium transporter n=2 Tax=Methylophaga TaxID=40222 RepID=UPI000C3E1FC1|nr:MULTISPECIES: ammonium transporter [unclassified Methylophaga]MAL50445.1 diguanylate cyclase [Methylophaga sp.]MBP26005.1 diguanylate cyclase [Methylophaga sp.]|tara:strand:- start:10178 stop:13603 length:3426 start_codon:yes stop_codon:yes gene_type:complete